MFIKKNGRDNFGLIDYVQNFYGICLILKIGVSVEDRNGYVGCMRGLRINGVFQDLRGFVYREEVIYGVLEGCVGKCVNQMCFNGGICIEGYSGYICDCAYTFFRGWNCGRGKGYLMLQLLL